MSTAIRRRAAAIGKYTRRINATTNLLKAAISYAKACELVRGCEEDLGRNYARIGRLYGAVMHWTDCREFERENPAWMYGAA